MERNIELQKFDKAGPTPDTVEVQQGTIHDVEQAQPNGLKRDLKNRHMQMIAIGGLAQGHLHALV